tara:strand:- start:1087 stop:1566 length:480 start_codon:yes stop_codon:yes gene_type:complete
MGSTYRKKCVKGISKPDKNRIAKYWNADMRNCMACGIENVRTDRAHIIPLQYNGTNELENIHLLCNPCHAESENLMDKEYDMWIKLKNEMYSKGAYSSVNCIDGYNRFLILDRIIRSGKRGAYTLNISIPEEDALEIISPMEMWFFINSDLLEGIKNDN